jgi:hypothetical protein
MLRNSIYSKRVRDPDDPFFALGNKERELWWKKASVPNDPDEAFDDDEAIPCTIEGCKAILSSVHDYELHYQAAHINNCSVCRRVFPSSRLLSIHLDEAHSSFFAVMSARGESNFLCLVEGCPRTFKGDFQRQRHLIDFHRWPSTLSFPFHPTLTARAIKQKATSTKHAMERR